MTVTQSDPIRRIMQEFNMNHPLIMGPKLRINTIKAFSESDQFSKVSQNFSQVQIWPEYVVLYSTIHELHGNDEDLDTRDLLKE